MNIEQTCATCRWYEAYDDVTGACTNNKSPNWVDFTIPEDTCKAWEGKDG